MPLMAREVQAQQPSKPEVLGKDILIVLLLRTEFFIIMISISSNPAVQMGMAAKLRMLVVALVVLVIIPMESLFSPVKMGSFGMTIFFVAMVVKRT